MQAAVENEVDRTDVDQRTKRKTLIWKVENASRRESYVAYVALLGVEYSCIVTRARLALRVWIEQVSASPGSLRM